MNGLPWYRIEDRSDDAEVFLYNDIGRDEMGGISAEVLIKDLAKLKAKTLHVRINSGGGNVFEGLAIHNALTRHPAHVVTHIDGIAASIASVVAMAGKEIRMAKNGFLMIHNAHARAGGNATELRTVANTLESVTGSLAGVYIQRTGQSAEQVKQWMDGETWFNAQDAKAAGFVDVVTNDLAIAASYDLSRFQHPPEGIATAPGDPDDEALRLFWIKRLEHEQKAASILKA